LNDQRTESDERMMAPAEDLQLYPDFRPEPLMKVADPETLRALSDATRVRILETMVQRQDPPWSVKELAVALGVPQTRLYHHVEQLLAHDLLRAVERRVVSGIIETRYRVTALSIQLDRRMFAGDGPPPQILHDTLVAVFDTARDEVEQALHAVAAGGPDGAPDDRMLVTRGLARLTPERAAELRRRLVEIEAEFGNDAPTDGAQPFGVVLAVYPVASPATASHRPQPTPTAAPEPESTEPTDD
jgi:DNA-binding transcriptional ArsR family regulator